MNSIVGTWDLRLKTPIGSLAAVYTFTDTAGAIAGTAEGSGETVPLSDVASAETADGLHVTWRQSVTKPLRLNLDFDVTVVGDTLSGWFRAGRLPASSVTGPRRDGGPPRRRGPPIDRTGNPAGVAGRAGRAIPAHWTRTDSVRRPRVAVLVVASAEPGEVSTVDMPPRRAATALLVVVALVVAGQWLGPVSASGQPAGTPVPVSRPVPVVYDSDMDFDDASTLALLCEEHKLGRIDLRAVTVANNGFGEPRRALTHARSVLEQCGLPQVPIADGATGAGVHPAPPELVSTIETVLTGALDDADHPTPPSRWTAAQLIALAAGTAPGKVVVLATGPLTNVADALASDRVRKRIARIHVMGGALAVPGNLYGSALPGFDNSQEFNMWMDPASAQRMLARARPGSVRLVPLDATRFVPITPAFVSRLGADQNAPGARIAYRIASQPDLAALIELGIMYWWDALAAVSVVHDGIVTESRTVPVSIVRDGAQSGRTVTTRPGTPVRAALEADRAAFEETFLDSLNGRR